MLINASKTAISRGVARSVKDWVGTAGNVLDYGAGKFRNTHYLREQGHNVHSLLEPVDYYKLGFMDGDGTGVYTQENIPTLPIYQTVFCTFVLNVIPTQAERGEVVRNIQNLLVDGGIAVFEARTWKDVEGATTKEWYNDGYLMGSGSIKTFQRGFTGPELRSLIEAQGLEVVRITERASSTICIARKVAREEEV